MRAIVLALLVASAGLSAQAETPVDQVTCIALRDQAVHDRGKAGLLLGRIVKVYAEETGVTFTEAGAVALFADIRRRCRAAPDAVVLDLLRGVPRDR